MQVLFTAYEADPFMKTGGLADVAGSMPAAVKKLDGSDPVDIRVMLPKASVIPQKYVEQMKYLGYFYVIWHGVMSTAGYFPWSTRVLPSIFWTARDISIVTSCMEEMTKPRGWHSSQKPAWRPAFI